MGEQVYLDWIGDGLELIMVITNFDRNMFHQARLEAMKSTHEKFHIGCIVVYKHKIISRGFNSEKTHPIQDSFNRFREFNNYNSYSPSSIHAEIAALCSIRRCVRINVNWSKVKVYVYRLRKNGDGACAKPCSACENFMRFLGISGCYYSEDNNCLAYISYE